MKGAALAALLLVATPLGLPLAGQTRWRYELPAGTPFGADPRFEQI